MPNRISRLNLRVPVKAQPTSGAFDEKAEVTHDLQRFLDAQASVYEQARSELASGQKRSHWMWFIFPQIRGLGSSPTAQRFAISGLDEAVAYFSHPVLGARLRECT